MIRVHFRSAYMSNTHYIYYHTRRKMIFLKIKSRLCTEQNIKKHS
jgi:hypothetical protein